MYYNFTYPMPKFIAKIEDYLSRSFGLVATVRINIDADSVHVSTRPLTSSQRVHVEALRSQLPVDMTLTFDESLPAWAGWLERIKVYSR